MQRFDNIRVATTNKLSIIKLKEDGYEINTSVPLTTNDGYLFDWFHNKCKLTFILKSKNSYHLLINVFCYSRNVIKSFDAPYRYELHGNIEDITKKYKEYKASFCSPLYH